MGQKVSNIAYNEEYQDINTVGLSKTQVSLIKENFYAILEECNVTDKKMTPNILSNLLKIPKEEIQLLVEFVDLDGDGKLDEYDFVCMVGLFTKASLEEKMESIFYIFDEDYSQIISGKELEKLVKCIVSVKENTTNPSSEKIKQKLLEIQEDLFKEKPEMKMQEFFTLTKEDEDFKNVLKLLGIFGPNDFKEQYIEDVQAEFEKGAEEYEGENQNVEKRRLGLEQQDLFEQQTEQADEFMAVKPFLGTVQNSVPSNFNEKQINISEPNANLELEFVHGYRCFDTRNNIYFIDEDNFIFHSAGVGIKMNISQRKQNFNFSNTDDITCIDKYGDLIATGQMGHKPLINIWSAKTMETLSIIVGTLQKGIAHVAFSANGQFLAGIGMNDDHDIAIYDVSQPESPKLFANCKGIKDVVLDLKFNLDCKSIILPTKNEIYIATFSKNAIKINKSTGMGKNKQMSLCIGFLKGIDFAVGLQSGEMAIARGNSISKILPAHKKLIYAMTNNEDYSKLFTGGADGKVLIWDENLTIIKEIIINSNEFISSNPKIRALSFCDSAKKLLIGTRGGEIIEYEIQSQKKSFVLHGHFDKELWGLAVHPIKEEFITVGEDFLLGKWNISKRNLIQSKILKYQANTCHIHPNGNQIAIGSKNGCVLILNYSDLSEQKQLKVSQKEITQVKFSKDGNFLAMGSRDSKIYVYATSSYKKVSICKGHHSTITHLDFSENSNVLQTNCTSYEILYWDAKTGKQDTKGASNNRDEQWASWTCVLGWPVQGIFPPCSDGTDINSVDRTKDGKIIVTGDDFGTVKLFRCPNFKGSSYNKFIGHSSHVTNVRFSQNEKYLISIGGNDKSVFQWKFENENNTENQYEDNPIEDGLIIEKEEKKEQTGLFEVVEEAADEFMAVKPWIGDLNNSIPSNYKYIKGMESVPDEFLEIQYVNGYRCFDARNSAKFGTDNNNVVFIAAALGVELNIQKNIQTFFNEHEEDLVSFDLHPNREIAATGQMAMKGKTKLIDIFVWDVKTKKVIVQLNQFHIRAIQLLKFSPDGNLLYTFGKDDHNSLAIYDWKNSLILSTAKVDQQNVLDITFLNQKGNEFLTVGSKHIKHWTVNGKNLKGTQVKLNGKGEAVLCCETISNVAALGTISGKLFSYQGGMGSFIQAHKGKIFVMCKDETNKILFTGGEDGIVNSFIFSQGKFVLQKKIIEMTESLSPKIRSLDVKNNDILIGTGASELFVIKNNEKNLEKKLILNGHFEGELWGLFPHPTKQIFITCGDDKILRKWSAENRVLLKTVSLPEKSRAVSFSNKGEKIVVGTMTGLILLFDEELNKLDEYKSSFTKKDQWIEDIKFSPNDEMIAFGAHGGASKLEILQLSQNKLKKKQLANIGLTSALLHLDWDVDSSMLVINSQAYELKHVSAQGGNLRASSCKDVEWFSWTCKLGFPVQGIFPGVDGTDVNTVDRSKNKKIIATGDDFQLVKIFKCPSVVTKSGFRSYKGHSSHVTRVKFSANDQFLISIGGNDKTSIIWRTSFKQKKENSEIKEQKNSEENEEENLEENCNEEFVEIKKKKNKYGIEEIKENQVEEQKNENGFQIEEVEETEFMAVKPWLGAIRAPSNFIANSFNQNSPPKIQVNLEYVYGYRARDSRNNLFLLDNNLYYFAAALDIKLDFASNNQEFFQKHTDDVISLTFSETKGFFASGELGPKPKIFIWDKNMEQIQILKQGVIKGVCGLAFSPDGSKLAAICIDDNHHVVVFDSSSGEMQACEKGDTANIVDLEWIDEKSFVTCGMKHFKTWILNGKNLKGVKGNFGKNNDLLFFAKRFKNNILCGSGNGQLQIWNGGSCTKSIELQKLSLDAIAVTKSNKILTGGKNCIIHLLDENFKILKQFNLNKFLFEGLSNKIRALTTNQEETEIYIGIYSSQIFRIYSESQKIENFSEDQLKGEQLMTGHYARNLKWTNEVWGLWPLKNDFFLTVSDDSTLRLWNSKEKKQNKYLELNIDSKGAQLEPNKVTKDLVDQAKLRSVTVCNEEKHIAVGCYEGTVRIIDLKKWKQIKLIKLRKRWIQELKYSPDNSKLAIGSHDAFIDIYDVPQNYKILFKMKKHSAFITHLDWSIDSQNIHSNCGAYELLFFNCNNGQQLTSGASALRDEDWASWSCVLGWPVQGIFQPEWDGSDINMVDRSRREFDGCRILACADDFSQIRLYKYPCLDKGTQGVVLKGHSSHVTNVKFGENDEILYSTGGEDQCVMQWKLTGQVNFIY